MGFGSSFGPRPQVKVNGTALTTAAGETTLFEMYVDAGTQGIILHTYHTSAGSGTMLYKIYELPYTADNVNWPSTSPVQLLASTAGAKTTQGRLVVDPRVTAVANTHAQTPLGQRIRVTGTAATADVTGVFVSVTNVS